MIAGWKITTVRRALDELMHFIEVNEKPHGWEGKPGRVSMYVRRSDGKFESRGATGSTLQEAMAALSAELAAQMEADASGPQVETGPSFCTPYTYETPPRVVSVGRIALSSTTSSGAS